MRIINQVRFRQLINNGNRMLKFIYNDIDFKHKLDRAGESSEFFGKYIHPFNELLYFISGNVVYTVEAESRKLEPGDIVFIPAGKYHFATVDISKEYERCVLKFPDSFVPQYIKEIRDFHSSFLKNSQQYVELFERLDEMSSSYSDEELYSLYVCELVRLLVDLYHGSSHPVHKEAPAVIKLLLEYINENLDKRITLDSLSKATNFSKSYISNSFKLYMKTPIIQYVRTKKILMAHKMIEGGAKPYQVAKDLGFDDYSTFYRSYVSIMGFAPSEK